MIEDNKIIEVPEELLAHIKDLEGLELKAYYDVNGVLTIGYGHTNATGTFKFDESTKISEDKALAILIADLNKGLFHVNNMLNNRGLTVNDTVKEYMVLVYLNRPWALAKTMKDIATMNADIAKQSQLDVYKEVNGTEAPDWYVNRIEKEFAYLNEFDDKSVDGGNGVIEDEWTKYRLVGRKLVPEDATAELWSDVLKKLYGVTSPFPDVYKPPTQTKVEEEQPMFKKILSGVADLINTSIDKQLDFMENTYDR